MNRTTKTSPIYVGHNIGNVWESSIYDAPAIYDHPVVQGQDLEIPIYDWTDEHEPEPEQAIQGVDWGIRNIASFIDTLIVFLIIAAMGTANYQLAVLSPLPFNHFADGAPAGVYLFFLAALLAMLPIYKILFEGFYGATIGKLIFGLRVIHQSGFPILLSESLKREVFQILDWLTLGYFPTDFELNQHYGDLSSGTVVVAAGEPVIEIHRSPGDLLVAGVLYLSLVELIYLFAIVLRVIPFS